MRIVLDTNAYVDVCKDVAGVADLVEAATEVALPAIVLGELRAGFAGGARSLQNERNIQRFLSRSEVTVLTVDQATTHAYAGIYLQLRSQGTPIPTNDMWIAALTLQHDLVLLTRDRHFDHLPQLRRA